MCSPPVPPRGSSSNRLTDGGSGRQRRRPTDRLGSPCQVGRFKAGFKSGKASRISRASLFAFPKGISTSSLLRDMLAGISRLLSSFSIVFAPWMFFVRPPLLLLLSRQLAPVHLIETDALTLWKFYFRGF